MIPNCPEQAIILKLALHHGPRRRNEEWDEIERAAQRVTEG